MQIEELTSDDIEGAQQLGQEGHVGRDNPDLGQGSDGRDDPMMLDGGQPRLATPRVDKVTDKFPMTDGASVLHPANRVTFIGR